MPFLTEMHAHTSEVSRCAHLDAAGVAARYLEAGYTTLVIANHFNNYTLDTAGSDWQTRAAYYLRGWRKAVDTANGRLHVLLGMEIRFPGSMNDYLVYGLDEEYLLAHPYLYDMNLRDFSELVRRDGLLIIQAHPFRNGMTVMQPELLDGYEVFNGHVGHDSRNPIARAWCRTYGKIPTSGSDFHDPTSVIDAGIQTDVPITDMKQLCAVLRSGKYTIHCGGALAQREHLTDFPAADL